LLLKRLAARQQKKWTNCTQEMEKGRPRDLVQIHEAKTDADSIWWGWFRWVIAALLLLSFLRSRFERSYLLSID
jgi:hypothetical protein